MSDEAEAEVEQSRVDRKIYLVDYVEQGRKLAQLGATDAEIADFFGVARFTITRWKVRHPEFGEALRVGKDAPDQRVVRSLFHRAVGYDYVEQQAIKVVDYDSSGKKVGERVVVVEVERHVPADTTAQIFWLKNRDKENWRDKQTHEHTGKDGAAIEHKATVEAVMELLPKVRDEC